MWTERSSIMFQLFSKHWWMKPTVGNTSSGWPERRVGPGLSIARGALHPHLLARGWRWLPEKKDGRPNCPAARSPLFLYAAGSLSEVMSHVSSFFARSVAAPGQRRRGMMEWREKKRRDGEREKGREKEKEGNVCSSDHRQFLSSAPGRFSIYLFLFPPSVSFSLVAPRMKRTKKGGLHGFDLFLGSDFVLLWRAVPRSVRPSFTALCWRWVSAWWPTHLHGYCCTNPEGVCRDPDSAHLQKTCTENYQKP